MSLFFKPSFSSGPYESLCKLLSCLHKCAHSAVFIHRTYHLLDIELVASGAQRGVVLLLHP